MSNKIIFNGGEPLDGCPKSWEDAYDWQDKSNENPIHESMEWSFDCGFKLDFDGSLLQVSSRFYPPKEYYGTEWHGNVTFFIFDKEIKKQEFKAKTLDELKHLVELYVKNEANILMTLIEKPKGVNLTWYVILFIISFVLGALFILNVAT